MTPYEKFAASLWRWPSLPSSKKKKKAKPIEQQLAQALKRVAGADRKIGELLQARPTEVKELEAKVKELNKMISGQGRKIQELMDELVELKKSNG